MDPRCPTRKKLRLCIRCWRPGQDRLSRSLMGFPAVSASTATSAFLDDKLGPVRNATNANLKPFKNAGGKLILYHGWSDPDIAPLSTINYYENVTAKMSDRTTREFVRLYMVPGMQHCGGGAGATVLGSVPSSGADGQNGLQAALERWVEKASAPREIIATKYKATGARVPTQRSLATKAWAVRMKRAITPV